MPLRNTAEAYGSVAKFLHWSIVLLILPQYFLAEAAEDYAEGSLEAARVMGLHQSLGLLVLVLALVRIAWKVANRPHPAPAAGVAWQRRSAAIGHGLLYLLVLLQPLSGWIMVSAAGAAPSPFGVPLPALAPENHSLQERLEDVHEALFQALLVVAAIHVAAALFHHFVLRDGTLRRMLPGRRRVT